MIHSKLKPGDFFEKMPGWLNVVSCAAIAALMLLVTLNVILRAVFNSPIMGTYDFTGFLTTVLIGFGLAQCAIKDGHIEITLFTDKMGRKARNAITSVGRIISSIVLAIYTYSLYQLATRYLKANELSVTSKTPICIFVYALSFCFLIFTVTAVIRALKMDSNQKEQADGQAFKQKDGRTGTLAVKQADKPAGGSI